MKKLLITATVCSRALPIYARLSLRHIHMQLQANYRSRLLFEATDAAWRQACCCPGEAGRLYMPLFGKLFVTLLCLLCVAG